MRDLLIETKESYKEKVFEKRCQNYLEYFHPYCIVDKSNNLKDFDEFFTNSNISRDDVYFFLIKKYVLANNNQISERINELVYTGQFNIITDALNKSEKLRRELLNNYITNINKSCYELVYGEKYDIAHRQLTALHQSYYKVKAQKAQI